MRLVVNILELKMARTRLGMSQTRLAAAAGISASHIQKIEKGTCRPSRVVAKRIAEAMGVDFDELFSVDIKNVVVLIPAHNEEQDIGATLTAIINQPFPANRIIVAMDNCSDGTENEVRKYSGVRWFHTRDNKAKKAGALNQALGYMLAEIGKPKYILQMDADTRIDEGLIAAGVNELEENSLLAGVCNRFRVRGYAGGSKFLYLLQSLEYSFYDSVWVEKSMNTHVLSGTAVILRWEALKHLFKTQGAVWDEKSVVEDFRLALDLKANKYEIKVGRKMFSQTDYMRSWKELWGQRKRWFYGTVEELAVEGWTTYTRKDIVTQIYSAVIGGFSILFFVLLATMLALGMVKEWHWLGQVLIGMILVDRLYRSRYIKNKTGAKMVVNLSILPFYAYGMFLTTCYYYSAYLALSGKSLNRW